MITPNKYLDLDLSILNIGAIILNILKEDTMLKYDELFSKIINSKGENAKDVFLPTLSFLYLLGKIEYNKEMDSIGYIS